MNTLLRMFSFKRILGDGTEIYIKSKGIKLNIQELMTITNRDYEYLHPDKDTNFCFIKFSTAARAAEIYDVLKQRDDLSIRIAYVRRNG